MATEISAKKEYGECGICFEPVVSIDPTSTTEFKCHHFFHNQCIGEWLEKRSSCPLCRRLVDRITIDIADTIVALKKKIAAEYKFHYPRLRLIHNNCGVPDASYDKNTGLLLDITIRKSGLRSGDRIWAVEYRETPLCREMPLRGLTLKVISHF